MCKLPSKAPYSKVMRLLLNQGFTPKNKDNRGSHVQFEKKGFRPIPVSTSKNIPKGTLQNILKSAKISRPDFCKIWNKL